MALSICNILPLMAIVSSAMIKNISVTEYLKEYDSNIFIIERIEKNVQIYGLLFLKQEKMWNLKLFLEEFY